mmetsp:Transcript_40984/g.39516  ORF Transcript_40984/g.39516 Transcript_40984/m.39516 type:complete len:209 (+) Transcript_40984:106-732(+)
MEALPELVLHQLHLLQLVLLALVLVLEDQLQRLRPLRELHRLHPIHRLQQFFHSDLFLFDLLVHLLGVGDVAEGVLELLAHAVVLHELVDALYPFQIDLPLLLVHEAPALDLLQRKVPPVHLRLEGPLHRQPLRSTEGGRSPSNELRVVHRDAREGLLLRGLGRRERDRGHGVVLAGFEESAADVGLVLDVPDGLLLELLIKVGRVLL